MNLSKCPACDKIGKTSSLRFFNINHDECVRLCSNKSCSYPFGYEDLEYSTIPTDSNSTQPLSDFDIEFDLSMFDHFEVKSNDDSLKDSKICETSHQNSSGSNLCSYKNSSNSLNDNDIPCIVKCTEGELSSTCDFNTNIENDNLKKLESDIIEDICSSVQIENSSESLPKSDFVDIQSDLECEKGTAKPNKIRVSRFPRFTLDDCDFNSENNNDSSQHNQSSTISVNTSPSISIDLTHTDSFENTNSNGNNFLNEIIDKICSQPDNINNKIITDSFIQNVIGI